MIEKRTLWILLHEDKEADLTLDAAVEALRRRGCTVAVQVAHAPDDMRRLVERAAAAGVDVLVAAGGDGTLNRVVGAVHDAGAFGRCAIAVLPGGTANDFATACGIAPDDPAGALELAATVRPVAIDLGRVNGRLFVNAASGGFGAEVTATTPNGMKRVLGGLAYLANGLLHIPKAAGHLVRVAGPGFDWEGLVIGFSVGNGRLAGGGYEIAPHALLDDGLLDLTIFPVVSTDRWIDVAAEFLASTEAEAHDYLVTRRASGFEIYAQDAMHLNLDGEPIQSSTFRFDVLERQARFCLPPTGLLGRRAAP